MARLTALLTLSLTFLCACSTAPKVPQSGFLRDYSVLKSTTTSQRKVDLRYADVDAINLLKRVRLEDPQLADLVLPADIEPEQMDLVANKFNRKLCEALAPYFSLVFAGEEADAAVQVKFTAIRPTGKKMAAASAVAGVISPFWIRVPAGLGGLAGEMKVMGNDERQLAAIVWARGASSFNSESYSSIGDAYALAASFAADASTLITKELPRTMRSNEQRKVGRARCLAHYGKTNMRGTLAGFLLPVSPEFKDAGKPTQVDMETLPQRVEKSQENRDNESALNSAKE
jgi:Protein of unknown function (DUF3313)